MGISIDEKRVYDASEGPTPVYVVGEFGVARVNTSDDLVGEFGLSRQCTARDAAGRGGRLAVATDEDVLVATATGDEEDTEFEALGVGPAVAVGFAGADDRTDAGLLVAREDGTLIRGDGTDWTELGEVEEVRAVDGDLVAAESGVYRATTTGLQHVGLEAVRDVSTAGVPLAATASGLYRLGNGWMDQSSGDFRAVSAASSTSGSLGWAHAASADGLLVHEGGERRDHEEDEWREVALPVESEVVALDHGESAASDEEDGPSSAYAVTEDGTFLLSVGDGWNHQILGLRDVQAVAAP